MDRALAPAVLNARRRRRWLLLAGLVAGVMLSLGAFRAVLQPSVDRHSLLTARVEIGAVEATLSAGGTVVPGREVVVAAPIASTIRRVLRQVGEHVKPGEAILELDKEQTTTALGKLRDEQARQQNKTGQLNLNLERALNDLQAQYATQQARVGALQAALRDEQYLLRVGGTTQENVRLAELNLRVAQLEEGRLRAQVATQRRTSAADQREVGFQLASQARDIGQLQERLRQADVSTDLPGVVTWVNENLGTTVQQGTELARVADLSTFKIRATISDSYADALHPGDGVVVRLGVSNGSASATDLRGTISSIAPAVDKGAVTFYARLDDPHHPALRPNLRVDVFVVTRAHPRTPRLKNGPFFLGGREQPVYVLRAGSAGSTRAVRQTARFGDSNFDHVQIIGGLQPGDEVIISDTKTFGDAPELLVKP